MEETLRLIQQELTKIQLKVQGLELQVGLMEPMELPKFKAKVLETLKTIDTDLDRIDNRLINIDTELKRIGQMDVEIAKIKTKIIIYTSIISTIAAVALSTLAKVLVP